MEVDNQKDIKWFPAWPIGSFAEWRWCKNFFLKKTHLIEGFHIEAQRNDITMQLMSIE